MQHWAEPLNVLHILQALLAMSIWPLWPSPAILPLNLSECSVEDYTLTTQINACSECNSFCFQQNLSHNIRQIRVGNQQNKESVILQIWLLVSLSDDGHLDDIISVNYCKNIASNKQKNHTLQIATILLHHMWWYDAFLPQFSSSYLIYILNLHGISETFSVTGPTGRE